MQGHARERRIADRTAAPDPAPVLHVGRWRVDLSTRSVTNGTVDRRLSPRALRVLQALAEAEGGAVDRATLLDLAWPGVTVSDESLTQAVTELRRAFGDRRGGASLIETIPKRGYRLTAPVLRTVPEARLPFDVDAEIFDLQAYQLCLEARTVLARSGKGALEASEALALEAARAAPGFALAQAEFAIAATQRHLYRATGSRGLAEAAARAEEAARLRPDLPIAHAAMGFVLGAAERWTEAKAAFSRALARDHLDVDAHYLCARTTFAARDHRMTVALAERAAQLRPDDHRALYLAARAAAAFDPGRARRHAEACLARVRARLDQDPGEPRALSMLAPLHALLDRPEEARAALAVERESDLPLEFYNVSALGMIGEAAEAVDALESVMDSGWRHPAWLSAEPSIAALAGTPRFGRLARSLGAA